MIVTLRLVAAGGGGGKGIRGVEHLRPASRQIHSVSLTAL